MQRNDSWWSMEVISGGQTSLQLAHVITCIDDQNGPVIDCADCQGRSARL